MVPKRRSVLMSLASFCSVGVAGCSAFDETPENDPETDTETTVSSNQSTPESTAKTTTETPTATLTPIETETTIARSYSQFTARDDESRYFGGSVEVSGDTAVVGAESTESDVDELAYVFVRSNGSWSRQAKLVPDNLETYEQFPVGVSGDTVLVGNYLYARTDGSWTQETTLVPDEEVSLEMHEISVAVDDDTAVVGNRNHESDGGVYVFQRSDESWAHQETLVHPDGEQGGTFGSAVSIDGDTVVAGSATDDTANGTKAGSAHVFTRSGGTWGQQATLTLDDGDEEDLFGKTVSLSGDTVMISASRDEDRNDRYSGTAYVFERADGDWHQQAQLEPTRDETQGDWLGNYGGEIALSGDTALLSGASDPSPMTQNGVKSVYLFSREGESWSQTQILDTENAEPESTLGPVALTEDTALVGSPVDDNTVYVYRI